MLDVFVSELLPDGKQVWARGSEIITITSTERMEFFRQFGLSLETPTKANRVYLSQHDYDDLKLSIAARLAQ